MMMMMMMVTPIGIITIVIIIIMPCQYRRWSTFSPQQNQTSFTSDHPSIRAIIISVLSKSWSPLLRVIFESFCETIFKERNHERVKSVAKVVRCKIGKITCFVDDARIFAHRKECTVEEKMHARKSEALTILCHLILFVLFVIVIIIIIII